jgi:hypothetical protein
VAGSLDDTAQVDSAAQRPERAIGRLRCRLVPAPGDTVPRRFPLNGTPLF